MKAKKRPSLIGAKLKGLRTAAGLSVRQVADAVGLPRTTYFQFEQRYAKPALPDFLVDRLVPVLEARGVARGLVRALGGNPGVTADDGPGGAATADAPLSTADRVNIHGLIGRWQSLRDQAARSELKELLEPLLKEQINRLGPDVEPIIDARALEQEARLAFSETIDGHQAGPGQPIERALEERLLQRVSRLYDERTTSGKSFWHPEIRIKMWQMELSRLIALHQRLAPAKFADHPIPILASQHHDAHTVELKIGTAKTWCRRPPGLTAVVRAYGLRMPSELSGPKYLEDELILVDGTALGHGFESSVDMNVLVHRALENHKVITYSGQIVEFTPSAITVRQPSAPDDGYLLLPSEEIVVHRILRVEDLV